MASSRSSGPVDRTVAADIGRRPQCSRAAANPGVLGREMAAWRAVQQGTPLRSPSPYGLGEELLLRAESACTLAELAQVAADAAAVRKDYERSGIISAPQGGDDNVKDVVRDSVTGPLGALQAIIVEIVWSTVDDGLDEGIRNGVATALWELTTEIIEARLGKLANAVAQAAASGRPKDVLEAFATAANELAASFKDRDGVMRNLLKIMRRNGLVLDQQLESRLRRYLHKVLERFATGILSVAKLLSSPVMIVIRIFFTSTAVVNDSGEIYHLFKNVEERLRKRYKELAPVPPQDRTTINPRWSPPSSGPTLSPRP